MMANSKTSKNQNSHNTIQLLSSLCVSVCQENSITIPYHIVVLNHAHENELLEKVFGNEMLLEEILAYAIHTKTGIMNPKLVQKVRTIQSNWLHTTTKLLKKLGKAVIILTPTKENSLNKMDLVKENGKLLDRFIQTFTTSEGMMLSAIPFKLTLNVEFFWEENYKCLLDCLIRLGCNLFELEITYPVDGGTMPVSFPNLDLSSLRKFSFKFSKEKFLEQGDVYDNSVVPFGNNARGMRLLQSILIAAKNLQIFDIPFIGAKVIPSDFKYLWLPPALLYLGLNIILKSSDLEYILRNKLPNLKLLKLRLDKTPLENDLLHKILERFQKTLTHFNIIGLKNNGNPYPRSYLKFPLMKNLETINIRSSECELGPGKETGLHKRLPNLICVRLNFIPKLSLKKWIRKSAFKNVEDLEISVIDENKDDENDQYFLSLDRQLLKRVHAAFPNVIDLTLTFNVDDLSGLNFLFQKMTKLISLQIILRGNLNGYNSDLFAARLLCSPPTLVTSLKERCENIRSVKIKGNRKKSIRNVSGLTSLILWAPKRQEDEDSLLSDVLISHGLLKMPKLQSLLLHRGFKPNPETSKLWKAHCRYVKYFPD